METPPPNTQPRNMSNIHATTRTETSINSSIDYEDKYHKSIDRGSKMPPSKYHLNLSLSFFRSSHHLEYKRRKRPCE